MYIDKRELTPTGCADYDRICREKAVLTRQLQEAKMALADVKTSWSGQIASLETQVNTKEHIFFSILNLYMIYLAIELLDKL